MHDFVAENKRIQRGGAEKYHAKNKEQGKLFARDRIAKLCDAGTFVEDGLFANALASDLPADGVVTGLGKVQGRTVAIMANDSTVKAGSWGKRTVEKILRIQEVAEKLEVPLFYLVDSAGARLTDQVEMFPGRRHAGRIFYNEAHLSGRIPQICLLFGPSAAGGAYIPAFCDVVIMVEGNASMYLGSPRMVEAVIGEKISLEDLGGARMHCSKSGCGDFLVKTEEEAISLAQRYFSYFPQSYLSKPLVEKSREPALGADKLKGLIPESPARAYDIKEVIRTLVDADSFLEVKELFAPELVTGFARMGGHVVGILANQTRMKGGVLFVDSADKAARFIQHCDNFNIPLLFLSDVPGFMVGSKVEHEGIIRSGAKMIFAVSRASVPKICVVLRKAYGAGLYAMCGPAFGTDSVIALPSANIAVMGPEPAVNAVYANKMAEMSAEEKKQFMKDRIEEYNKDIDLLRLAGELIVDNIVDFEALRSELVKRYAYLAEQPSRTRRLDGLMPM
ncbi:MAG: acyl-CoA carboxylase subunit beta [Bdellovibrionales bacterium]|nr:acyl-CoA carboxylase subunit beta [Bdellovibrionales bacterium]